MAFCMLWNDFVISEHFLIIGVSFCMSWIEYIQDIFFGGV